MIKKSPPVQEWNKNISYYTEGAVKGAAVPWTISLRSLLLVGELEATISSLTALPAALHMDQDSWGWKSHEMSLAIALKQHHCLDLRPDLWSALALEELYLVLCPRQPGLQVAGAVGHWPQTAVNIFPSWGPLGGAEAPRWYLAVPCHYCASGWRLYLPASGRGQRNSLETCIYLYWFMFDFYQKKINIKYNLHTETDLSISRVLTGLCSTHTCSKGWGLRRGIAVK